MTQPRPKQLGWRRGLVWTGLLATAATTITAFLLLSMSYGSATPAAVGQPDQIARPATLLGSPPVPPVEPGAPVSFHAEETPSVAEINPDLPCPGKISGIVEELGLGPVPNAVCSLLPGEAPSGLSVAIDARPPDTAPVASVVSDARGAFELPAAPGYWTLLVKAEGLASWREDSVPSGASKHVLLEPQQTLVLSVVNEQGVPVADAECRLLVNLYFSRSKARYHTRSDEDGRAEIPLQAGESWFIEVVHPSYRHYGFSAPTLSGEPTTEMTVVLTQGISLLGRVIDSKGRVPAESEVLVDILGPRESPLLHCDLEGHFDSGPIFYPDTELYLTGRAPGYGESLKLLKLDSDNVIDRAMQVEVVLEPLGVTVVGQVVTQDGKPPGTVDVLLQPFAEGSYFDVKSLIPKSVSWRAMTSIDDKGLFIVTGLKSHQQYRVLAVPRRDYTPVQARMLGAEPGTTSDLGQLQLTAGGKLFGFAHHLDGTPAAHLLVSALAVINYTNAQGKDPDFFLSQLSGRLDAFSNQQGRFDLMLFNSGDSDSYELYWGENWRVNDDHFMGTFRFSPGQVVGPIDIIVPDVEIDDGSINGTITDFLDDTVESILVEVWNGPATDQAVGEGFLRGARSRADGTFTMGSLPAGTELRITATDLRGRFKTQTTHATPSHDGTTLDLVLTPAPISPSVLEGVVEDADGQPLPGIDLKLFFNPLLVRCSSCMNFSARTDGSGHFSFGLVVDGQHVVNAVDSRGVHQPSSADVRPGVPAVVVMVR